MISRHVPGGSEENHAVKKAGAPSEIRNEHFPNKSLHRYRKVNPLGSFYPDLHRFPVNVGNISV
jgi:hypothetical protein